MQDEAEPVVEREGGLVLYDSADFTPPPTDRWRQVPVPLTDIAKNQLKFELGKNVVAVGVCAALFGLPMQYAERILRDAGFSKADATAFVSRVMRMGEVRRESADSTAVAMKAATRLLNSLAST